MSIKQMTKVWEWSRAEGAELLVMLAMADHADDEGNCFPGIERIARKCRISGRSVQRHIKISEDRGELQVELCRGMTVPGGSTNRYRITVNNPGQPRTASGDNLSGGDKNTQVVVTKNEPSGDKAVSPKPSVEPSVKHQAVSGDEIPAVLDTIEFTAAWINWKDYRREKKQALRPTTIIFQLKKLATFGPAAAVAAIYHSIEQGYTGLLPEKFHSNGQTKNHQRTPPSRNVGHNQGLDYSKRPKRQNPPEIEGPTP